MTEMLEKAIAELRSRPDEEQDVAAEALLAFLAREEPPDYVLTPEQIEEVRQTLEGLENGTERLATEDEVEAMWRRLGV